MAVSPTPAPGEGPVRPVSVSLHEDTIAALKARTGKSGMSAYVETLIQRRLGGRRVSGTLVLDCEGLSQLVRRSPELTEWLAAAEAEDVRVVTSSVTLVEARDPRTDQARFDYAVSRVNIVPPTEAVARQASKLLAGAGDRADVGPRRPVGAVRAGGPGRQGLSSLAMAPWGTSSSCTSGRSTPSESEPQKFLAETER